MRSMLACLLVLATSATVATAAAARTVRVDCDRGEDLGRVLAKAQRQTPLTIEIVGTCEGNFRIWADGVRLKGLSPEDSILVAPDKPGGDLAGTVLEIDDADSTVLIGLSIRGGVAGVHAHGWERRVSIIDCDVSGAEVGVYIDAGADAYVQGSSLRLNDTGMLVESSLGFVVESEIRDNHRRGLVAFRNSSMGVVETTVAQSGRSAAVAAEIQSSINLVDSTVSGYSEVQVLVKDRSKISLVGDTEVGCDVDGDCIGVAALEDASFHANAFTTVNGEVHIRDTSFAKLSRADVNGSVYLFEFARASLSSTTVSGRIECLDAGDALCGSGTVAETSGCPSAPAVCGAPVAD